MDLEPSISDRFWLLRKKDMPYGEACFELRMSASTDKAWRVNLLVNGLRKGGSDTAEDEIGLALEHAALNGHTNIVDLMLSKDCGEKPYVSPQVNHKFCNSAVKKRYDLAQEAYNKTKDKAVDNDVPKQVSDENRWDTVTWKEKAFCVAVSSGNLETSMKFLEYGTDIHALDDYALCSSIHSIDYDIFEALIERGADITARNFEIFFTAIFYATASESPEFLDKLLEQDVNIHPNNMYGILEMAMEEEHIIPIIVEKLLNFTSKMEEKLDVSNFLKMPHVQESTEVQALLKKYQSSEVADSSRKIKPAQRRL